MSRSIALIAAPVKPICVPSWSCVSPFFSRDFLATAAAILAAGPTDSLFSARAIPAPHSDSTDLNRSQLLPAEFDCPQGALTQVKGLSTRPPQSWKTLASAREHVLVSDVDREVNLDWIPACG
ncbi:hypothetical protein ACWCQ0_50775, partial [Streptomyces massasporeus]